MSQPVSRGNSTIKEALASWGDIARLLRGGEPGRAGPRRHPPRPPRAEWMTSCGWALYLS